MYSNNAFKVKRERGGKKKWAIISLSILASLIIIFLLTYAITGVVFVSFALDATFAAASSSPIDVASDLPKPQKEEEWFDQIEKTQTGIVSYDNYKLNAYVIRQNYQTNDWAILVHGYRGNATEMSYYAKHYYEKGYNLLMPDLKGHGQSEGKYIGMGYLDRLDMVEWINLLVSENSGAKIVLHGVSMGGATVMATTGETLPENVVCAIEDCGYSSAKEQFIFVLKNVLKLPFKSFIMSASEQTAKIRLGESLENMNIASQVAKSVTPTLFIHGTADNFVPYSMLDIVYNAHTGEKHKLSVEGAGHAYSATQDEKLYFDTVFDFISKYK